MTSRDFAFWLQGFLELSPKGQPMTAEQVQCIQNHLALVFVHEIDPSMGGNHGALQNIHDTGNPHLTAPPRPDGMVMRC